MNAIKEKELPNAWEILTSLPKSLLRIIVEIFGLQFAFQKFSLALVKVKDVTVRSELLSSGINLPIDEVTETYGLVVDTPLGEAILWTEKEVCDMIPKGDFLPVRYRKAWIGTGIQVKGAF